LGVFTIVWIVGSYFSSAAEWIITTFVVEPMGVEQIKGLRASAGWKSLRRMEEPTQDGRSYARWNSLRRIEKPMGVVHEGSRTKKLLTHITSCEDFSWMVSG